MLSALSKATKLAQYASRLSQKRRDFRIANVQLAATCSITTASTGGLVLAARTLAPSAVILFNMWLRIDLVGELDGRHFQWMRKGIGHSCRTHVFDWTSLVALAGSLFDWLNLTRSARLDDMFSADLHCYIAGYSMHYALCYTINDRGLRTFKCWRAEASFP